MSGKYILPGFIDSHIHGAAGYIINDEEPDFEKILRYEATQGVTSIAISTVCAPFDHLLHQLDLAVEAAQLRMGAKIIA